jgi:alkanesulfonate monooxygenase SsuD/methylene tetrahydromethanopterin reductase-like flavin-dependent oxidoreductase (luciferase family)
MLTIVVAQEDDGGTMSGGNQRPVKIGLYINVAERMLEGGRSPRWADIRDMAQRAEQVGFDSVWIPDHLVFRMPDTPPEGFWECGATLAALAASTARVQLGTLVVATSFRNPALLAKMADTIDEISAGRLILGLGAGYHDPEYRAYGYPTDHRYSRFKEALEIIHSLLRDGRIDYDGFYYQARDCELRPRGPRQQGPPIMIGTQGAKMLELTARYADIWNGWLAPHTSRPNDYTPMRARVDVACEATGRDPATLTRTVSLLVNLRGRTEVHVARLGTPLTGNAEEIGATLREFADMGVEHIQVWLYPGSVEHIEAFAPVLELLDQ